MIVKLFHLQENKLFHLQEKFHTMGLFLVGQICGCKLQTLPSSALLSPLYVLCVQVKHGEPVYK